MQKLLLGLIAGSALMIACSQSPNAPSQNAGKLSTQKQEYQCPECEGNGGGGPGDVNTNPGTSAALCQVSGVICNAQGKITNDVCNLSGIQCSGGTVGGGTGSGWSFCWNGFCDEFP